MGRSCFCCSFVSRAVQQVHFGAWLLKGVWNEQFPAKRKIKYGSILLGSSQIGSVVAWKTDFEISIIFIGSFFQATII
jgi:hypothetical protein